MYPTKRQEMKELASSRPNRAVFEIIEKTSEISWASDFALSITGYGLDEIVHMTLVNLAPEFLASRVSSTWTSIGDSTRSLIWPIRSADKTVTWWYATTEASESGIRWFSAQLISRTDSVSEDYVRMYVLMDILNSQHDLTARLSDHEKWTQNEITELRRTDQAISQALESIRNQQKHIISISKNAADGTMETRQLLKSLRSEMDDGFTNQMVEILKLIQTDALHDERIEAFDKHMKNVAQQAMTTMQESAHATAKEFQSKAVEAGKGLTRKVTVPVGLVAALMSGIQWLITNWDKLKPHWPHW